MYNNEFYMRCAIALARRAEGKTSPNPLVGAVIVRSGRIVGKGYHKKAGLPHAEINALRQAGKSAKGSTLYVTLEPCDHFGRTPPCTLAIIESGIRSVVVGMIDPNPINNGRGVRRLRKAGIRVTAGVMEEEARAINLPYIKFITRRLPYVTVKVAQTLDGKIATRTGDSKWITSADARAYVHDLRGKVDAVMVGANTVMRDDPLLTNRSGNSRQPARIVVDGKLKLKPSAKIFATTDISPVIIATTTATAGDKRLFKNKGVEILEVKAKKGRVDTGRLLKELSLMGITHILVEGGGELVASLVEERLVDRFLCFIAPKIAGGRDAKTGVEGEGIRMMKDAMDLKNIRIRRFAKDILISGDPA